MKEHISILAKGSEMSFQVSNISNPGLQSNQNEIISVLYVDDEEVLLTQCKLFLERSEEFRVDIMLSAHEALNSLKIQSYDVIISDYQMPEMDGIEFLKVIRSQFGDIPFVLFTGRGREEVVIEAIWKSSRHRLPFHLDELGSRHGYPPQMLI